MYIDTAEKMMFEDIQSDMKEMRDDTRNMNKNILYLCRNLACSEIRVRNIENVVNDTDNRLNICENKVTTLRSWGIAIGTMSIFVLPIIITVI
jgi:hypothetical protein